MVEEERSSKYLTFRVGREHYAIGIEYVSEIVIKTMDITEVPGSAGYFSGVINLRGRIIPIIDMRRRFGLCDIEYDEKCCIIVVNMNDLKTGLVVERVAEVIDIDAGQITDPPNMGAEEKGRFVKGMGKVGSDVKIVIDVDRLLGEDEKLGVKRSAVEGDYSAKI